MTLPDFPVDDVTLDLLWAAVRPGPDAERSSIGDVCDLYSQLAGSDLDAVAEISDGVRVMRDPAYHPNDVIAALITEMRRIRAIVTNAINELDAEHTPAWAGEQAQASGKEPIGCAMCWPHDGSWPCSSRLIADDLRTAIT